jgi:putative transposase
LVLGFSTYDPCWAEEENSMKVSKFPEAQIAFVLKQAEDRTPIGEVCSKAGIPMRPSTIGGKDMPV